MRSFLITPIVLCTLALLAAGLLFGEKQTSAPEPEIKYISYSRGGSSIGDSYTIWLKGESFTVTECPCVGAETTKVVYPADSDLYAELSGIIAEYDMMSWTDLPECDVIALDAATTSVDITLVDGTSVRFSDYEELPEHGWEAVGKLKAAFEARMDK